MRAHTHTRKHPYSQHISHDIRFGYLHFFFVRTSSISENTDDEMEGIEMERKNPFVMLKWYES